MPDSTSPGSTQKSNRAPSTEFLLVLLAIFVGLLICFGYSILFVSARGSVTARTMSGWHLKHIGLAVHNYAEAHHNQLPPPVVVDKAARPLYSWPSSSCPTLTKTTATRFTRSFTSTNRGTANTT
jgi:hypothetical protein